MSCFCKGLTTEVEILAKSAEIRKKKSKEYQDRKIESQMLYDDAEYEPSGEECEHQGDIDSFHYEIVQRIDPNNIQYFNGYAYQKHFIEEIEYLSKNGVIDFHKTRRPQKLQVYSKMLPTFIAATKEKYTSYVREKKKIS